MRVSLMVPQGNGPDSLHGCRPGTDESIQGNDFRHYSTSFLIMQDNCDIGETMRGYEQCEASMKQKEQRGEELTEMEKEIARGRLEMKDPAHGVGYGRWLMGEERWFDAFRQLSRIFWTSQRYVLNRMDDGGWVNTFVHLAHDVGKCLHKMGRATMKRTIICPSPPEGSPKRDRSIWNCLRRWMTSGPQRRKGYGNSVRRRSNGRQALTSRRNCPSGS